jgi:hypothetical protein
MLEFLRDSQLAQIDKSIIDRIAEVASSEGPVGETARLMSAPERTPEPSEEGKGQGMIIFYGADSISLPSRR